MSTENLDMAITMLESNANDLTIRSAADVEVVGETMKIIKQYMKQVDDEIGPSVKAANDAHKTAKALYNKHYDPLERAQRTLKDKLSGYHLEEQRKREAEQARLVAIEAAKAVEAERMARLELAAKRKAEAEALKAAGDKAAAEAKMAEKLVVPKFVPAPVVQAEPAVTKPSGASFTKVFVVTSIDTSLLPVKWMMPDEKRIREYVRSMGLAAKIPGVVVEEKIQVGVR